LINVLHDQELEIFRFLRERRTVEELGYAEFPIAPLQDQERHQFQDGAERIEPRTSFMHRRMLDDAFSAGDKAFHPISYCLPRIVSMIKRVRIDKVGASVPFRIVFVKIPLDGVWKILRSF